MLGFASSYINIYCNAGAVALEILPVLAVGSLEQYLKFGL